MELEHAEFELHADAVLGELRHDEDYAVVDVVKEGARELIHTLGLLLLRKDRDNQRGFRRKIKTWVFFLRSKCMRTMEGCHLLDQVQVGAEVDPLLTPHGQAALLQSALSWWCTSDTECRDAVVTTSSLPDGMQDLGDRSRSC